MSLGAIILAKCNLCFTYSFHISRVANVLFLNVCSFLRINNSEIHLLTSLSMRTHTWFVHLAVLYESVNWQENHHSQPPLCFAAAHLNLIWNERHFHIKNEFAFPLFLHPPPPSSKILAPSHNLKETQQDSWDCVSGFCLSDVLAQGRRGLLRGNPAQPCLKGDGNSSRGFCWWMEGTAKWLPPLLACCLSQLLLMCFPA